MGGGGWVGSTGGLFEVREEEKSWAQSVYQPCWGEGACRPSSCATKIHCYLPVTDRVRGFTMTIIVFLIDTSASMNQRTFIGARPTMLDIAKGAVETFVKVSTLFTHTRGVLVGVWGRRCSGDTNHHLTRPGECTRSLLEGKLRLH